MADSDSAVWRRLRGHGVVLAGHSYTHEFAAGGTTDQVANPWAPERTAGGSSGGSAAALAARMVPRRWAPTRPARCASPPRCAAISSIKPTYGRVRAEGYIPPSPTLDHPGPMARSVADAAALLSALATEPGGEPDAVVVARLALRPRGGPRPLEGLRVAVTGRPEAGGAEPDVLDGLQAARGAVERLGARVVELSAAPDVAPEDSVTILFHEVWPYHAALAERRDRYRPSIREFVDLARDVHDTARYAAAQVRRAEMTAQWRAWFADHGVDLLLEPTVPVTAQERGHGYDSGNLGGEGDPLIVFTATWNFTGFPVGSAPDRPGRPLGAAGRRLARSARQTPSRSWCRRRSTCRSTSSRPCAWPPVQAAASSSRAWRRAPTSSASAPSMRTSSADDLAGAQLADRRARRLGLAVLLDREVAGRERGDLRQVRDAEDLAVLGQRAQLRAHRARRVPADAGVDLVEDQRGLGAVGATP